MYGTDLTPDICGRLTTQHISFQIADPEKCDQMYESLANINGNIYRQRVSIGWKVLFWLYLHCNKLVSLFCFVFLDLTLFV